MPRLDLRYRVETLHLSAPFRISGFVFETSDVVVAELSDGEFTGRGEASGVYYLGDDSAHIVAELEAHRGLIEGGADREELRLRMPVGGARNAVDCAMWDLEAKREGVDARRLAGVDQPKPLVTTFTLGADDPDAMAEGARGYAGVQAIKMKLTGELALDIERVAAVRAARPDVWLGVDANQGFTQRRSQSAGRRAQPAPGGASRAAAPSRLRSRPRGLSQPRSRLPPTRARSALTTWQGLVGRFDVFNIKLDKCGGLTEALMIADEARRLGLGVMVGNMIGTSLAMAPAFIVGQQCDVVDLDGPTFLREDRTPACQYRDGTIWCADDVWGSRASA